MSTTPQHFNILSLCVPLSFPPFPFSFFSPDCAGCGAEIKQGQSLLALDKQWHVSCFRCRTCNMVLTGEYISKWVCKGKENREKQNAQQLLCPSLSAVSPRQGKLCRWHSTSKFLLYVLCCRDGVPYCEADYHAQYGVKCETCSRYISGRVLEVRTEPDVNIRWSHRSSSTEIQIGVNRGA